jgi:hypothetical protein
MVDLELYGDDFSDFEKYKEHLQLQEIAGRIQTTTKVIHVGSQPRQLASCFVMSVEDDLVRPSKMVAQSIKYGVHTVFPFEIVNKQWLMDNEWISFEYELFDDYQKSVRAMLEKSFNYYKDKKDDIMVQTYIDCIEDHREEHPHLWI